MEQRICYIWRISFYSGLRLGNRDRTYSQMGNTLLCVMFGGSYVHSTLAFRECHTHLSTQTKTRLLIQQTIYKPATSVSFLQVARVVSSPLKLSTTTKISHQKHVYCIPINYLFAVIYLKILFSMYNYVLLTYMK